MAQGHQYVSKNVIKIGSEFGAIFQKKAWAIVQGICSNFGATFKIDKKSNFDWNQLKLSTQHKYMYMHQENL